jgi:hypothetical protein
VVANVRERLAVSKQTTNRVHMERFNLKKLNEVGSNEQHIVEISNRFSALKTKTMMWILIELRKQLERIS